MGNVGGQVVPRFDLRQRTERFTIAVLRLASALPRDRAGDVVGRQLLKAGTSVAANYRSACRARSRRDCIATMAIVEEEADESQCWLEVISAGGLLGSPQVLIPQREAGELVAIASSIRTARKTPHSIPHSACRTPNLSDSEPDVH
jgi:four helix bundle protein